MSSLNLELNETLSKYSETFSSKIYSDENNDHDILMDTFNISPSIKRENRQYWGRELGMCWQLLVNKVFEINANDLYAPALKINKDEPCDLIYDDYAIDTKYRIGSGDSGTLKKFKSYGQLLIQKNYKPLLLILREDNLPSAIKACYIGNWDVRMGQEAFDFIYDKTNFDLYQYLKNTNNTHFIDR